MFDYKAFADKMRKKSKKLLIDDGHDVALPDVYLGFLILCIVFPTLIMISLMDPALLSIMQSWWHLYIKISVFIIVVCVGCYIKLKLDIKNQQKEFENIQQQMKDLINPDGMYERLGVDMISIKVGQGLLCIVDPDKDGLLLPQISALRLRLTDDLGYIIPIIKVQDSKELKENEYLILVRDNVVDTNFVYPGKYMVDANQWDVTGKTLPEDAITTDASVYKEKAYWVNTDIADENKDMPTVAPVDVIIQHLREVLVQQVEKVISEKDIIKCVKLVQNENPVFIDNLLDKLSYEDIRQVYVNLIREKVSVKDVFLLMSRLACYSRYHKEPDILSERIRKDFSRQISLAHSNNGKIYAVDLSQELTTNLLECVEIQKEYNKTKLALNKEKEQDLVKKVIARLMEIHKKIGIKPVLLCDEKLRLALYRLLVKYMPTVIILANNEIEQDIKLEIVDTII